MGARRTFNLEKVRQDLLACRSELERISQATAESRRPVTLDQTTVGRLSRMDALQGQAMALETGRRRDIELQRIDSALKRIDEGDYGYCVSCGEEIETRRLDHDPTTPICIDCAKTS